MSQYFNNDDKVLSEEKLISFYFNKNRYELYSDNGVFSKDTLDFGSRVLLESLLKENLQGEGIDEGCGIGVIGIVLSNENKNVIMDFVDINERAINLTIKNVNKYGLNESEVVVSDILKCIQKSYTFIVSNPPIRAGKKVVFSFYKEAYDHLRKNGVYYIVIQKKQGAESSIKKLNEIFGNCEIINKEKGYYILKSIKL